MEVIYMEKYCQNPLCENEAVKQVPVSVRRAGDQKRSLCAHARRPIPGCAAWSDVRITGRAAAEGERARAVVPRYLHD